MSNLVFMYPTYRCVACAAYIAACIANSAPPLRARSFRCPHIDLPNSSSFSSSPLSSPDEMSRVRQQHVEDMNAMELRIAQKDAALADMETEVHRSAQVSEQRQSGEILRRTREIEEYSLWE